MTVTGSLVAAVLDRARLVDALAVLFPEREESLRQLCHYYECADKADPPPDAFSAKYRIFIDIEISVGRTFPSSPPKGNVGSWIRDPKLCVAWIMQAYRAARQVIVPEVVALCFWTSQRAHAIGWLSVASEMAIACLQALQPGLVEDGVDASSIESIALLLMLHLNDVGSVTDAYYAFCNDKSIPVGDELGEALLSEGSAGNAPVLSRAFALLTDDARSANRSSALSESRRALSVIQLFVMDAKGRWGHSAAGWRTKRHLVAFRLRSIREAMWARDWPLAQAWVDELGSGLSLTNDPDGLFGAELQMYHARLLTRREQFREAREMLERARQIFEPTRNAVVEAKILRYEAELEYRRRNFIRSIDLAERAAETADINGNSHDVAMAGLLLGKAHSVLGYSGRAQRFITDALKHFSSYHGIRTTLDGMFWLATSYARSFGRVDEISDRSARGAALLEVRRRLLEFDTNVMPESDPFRVEIRAAQSTTKAPDVAEALFGLSIGEPPTNQLVKRVLQRAQSSLESKIWYSVCPVIIVRAWLLQGLLSPGTPEWATATIIERESARRVSSDSYMWPAHRIRHLLVSLLRRQHIDRTLQTCKKLNDILKSFDFANGLVPHLTEVMQYFVVREDLLCLLILVANQLRKKLEDADSRAKSEVVIPAGHPAIVVYAEIARFLIEERTLRVGRPTFARARIECDASQGEEFWSAAYAEHCRGHETCGVYEVGRIESGVAIYWLRPGGEGGMPKSVADFKSYGLHSDDLARAGALDYLAPITIVKSIKGGRSDILVLRIPEVSIDSLMKEPVGGVVAPNVENWVRIARRLIGLSPTPESTRRPDGAVGWVKEYSRLYFRDRLPGDLFRSVFSDGNDMSTNEGMGAGARRGNIMPHIVGDGAYVTKPALRRSVTDRLVAAVKERFR